VPVWWGVGAGRIVADFFYCLEVGDIGVIVEKIKSQLLARRI